MVVQKITIVRGGTIQFQVRNESVLMRSFIGSNLKCFTRQVWLHKGLWLRRGDLTKSGINDARKSE